MKTKGRTRRTQVNLGLLEGVDYKTVRVEGVYLGDGNSTECGLSAIDDTETALISDKDPNTGDFIMYRTTNSICGETKYLWQRAKILSVGDPLEANKSLKAVILRTNPSKKNAFTQDVALGPSNCGDGSGDGQIWFKIVDKATLASCAQQLFSRQEKEMMTRNHCIKEDVAGDGHCLRRSLLCLLYGMGSDTPERLRQLQYVLAAGLETFAEELDALAAEFGGEEHFKDYCATRAELFRGIDSSQPCPRNEWGGGEHGCDNFVFAALLKARVIISTPNNTMLHVYNSNFKVTEVLISDLILCPGDFFISHVWGGLHFIPYVQQGNLVDVSMFPLFVTPSLSVPNYFKTQQLLTVS